MLVLAPMTTELVPVVRAVTLAREAKGLYRGRRGSNDVIAALIGIGPARAAKTTQALLDAHRPARVVVAGVAGGVGADVQVGDLIVPEVVVNAETGTEHLATAVGTAQPTGRLVTSDGLLDGQELERLAASGVVAVDMETAAVAKTCEDVGCPWMALRGISDHFLDGLVDDATMGLVGPDGTPHPHAVARYVARRPTNAMKLLRLGSGTRAAMKAVTMALVDMLEAEAPGGPEPPD